MTGLFSAFLRVYSPPVPPFVELRARSAFSFGDGAVSPERLAAHAGELGYQSLGLVDACELGGIIRFTVACRKANMKPVIGAELLVDGIPLALLVRTAEGYRNLASLVTLARGGRLVSPDDPKPARGRPQVAGNELRCRAAGLTLLIGTADLDARALHGWRDAFGGHLAVEVQDHRTGGIEAERNAHLIELAQQSGIRWTVTQDSRYVDHESRLVHEMLTALRHRVTLDQLLDRGLGHPNGEWQLLQPADLALRWQGLEEGLDNAAAIASECDFSLDWARPPLPTFPVDHDHTGNSMLRARTFEGASRRWGEELSERQRNQLEHELGVIGKLGFAGFFLVMWDCVREAHRLGILAQGRGSAANSAVAYCLGITAVDPVENGLLFERFLSEGRIGEQVEAPDIDVDLEHDRREEILDYMYRKYDRSKSAITAVTQLYSAPTAVQDAMRAMGLPSELAFRISRKLRRDDCLQGVKRLHEDPYASQGLDLESPQGKLLTAIMTGCHDLPRIRSTHPGGFVLSSAPLGEHAPIEWTSMGRSIIQFDKDDLDLVGIPKFDFLGLGALSVVRRAFDAIEAHDGARPELYSLPQDDRPTYELISSGETIGMFQIESRAQITSIMHTRPEHLYDVAVQIALVRPGPIQARFVKPYTERRRGREKVIYPHPRLEGILKRTQGIPIFQEQAMSISMELAGYSAAEADALRRSMGHYRKRDRLLEGLQELKQRMIAKGVTTEVAEQIATDLESFANYGFPESHAWSFALIAYATAWLKAHHPAALCLGLLNAQPMGFYPISTLIHDARRHGVKFLPACLKEGASDCILEKSGDGDNPLLRIGWRFTRGLGSEHGHALTEARKTGPFEGIADVIARAGLDRMPALALAKAGLFRAWEPEPRRAAWQALRASGDRLPLAPARVARHDPAPLSRLQQIELDYHSGGYSLEGHLMECWRERLNKQGVDDIATIRQRQHGETVLTAGLVIARQRPPTANGVTFLLLEDEHGLVNVIAPASVAGEEREAVRHAIILLVLTRVERDGPVLQLLGQRFRALTSSTPGHRSRDFK